MKIFLMNDDYNTVIVARNAEQATSYFRSLYEGDSPMPYEPEDLDCYCTVKQEIDPNKTAIFEDLGEKTFGEMAGEISNNNIPAILCWTD